MRLHDSRRSNIVSFPLALAQPYMVYLRPFVEPERNPVSALASQLLETATF